MPQLNDLGAVEATVRQTVAGVTISDIHTHLFPPSHGKMLLWGIDELLTFHYLVAETFMVTPRELTYKKFWAMSKTAQADVVWEHLFVRRGPLSESARGLLTTLWTLGLGSSRRDLSGVRRWFAGQKLEDYLPKVLKLANIDYLVMTNNPFVAEEAKYWKAGLPVSDRFKTALRIDTLIVDWPSAAKAMRAAGYKTAATGGAAAFAQARKFLAEWVKILKPVYLAASLPPDFAYPSPTISSKVMDQVVLPTAKQFGLPVAMMMGVRKHLNPALGDGGDGVGESDMTALQNLLIKHPDAKFIATVLSRVNQQELCVLARKFGHLHVEGCWWFCNNPSIIEEMTRMRLELLGTAFTAQHSDARVLEQVIYKWAHMRTILADILAEKFRDSFLAGWRPTEADIRRDVRALLGGSFEEFCKK
ncbi:MAG: glucuronate isomerase [Alphaproteobacteria bacterium]